MIIQEIKQMSTQQTTPFEVKQAMVAIEMGPTDEPLLDYLDFFTSTVPTSAAYFVHVLERIDAFDNLLERETMRKAPEYEIDDSIVKKMETRIKSLFDQHENLYVEFDVQEGDPLEELLKDAKDVNADLLVIGQRTDTEYHGILSKNLVRKVNGNALIVPDQAKPQLKTILVPIDFSKNSVRALHTALSIRLQMGEDVRIICMNVYETPNLSVYKTSRTIEQLSEMIEADHREGFNNFIDHYAPDAKGVVEQVLVRKDLPGIANYIMDYAENEGVDLVVMGAKGHSNVDLLLMGSVTEKLMTLNESIPALIVK
jgi:nucleotide-binding universal stress UspA family protein